MSPFCPFALAEPGSICVSGKVYDEIAGKIHLAVEDLGPQQVKMCCPIKPADFRRFSVPFFCRLADMCARAGKR